MEIEKDSVTTVQNNFITSSSDMEQIEPPAKRNKIETESKTGVESEVEKENGAITKKDDLIVTDGSNDISPNKTNSPVKTSTTTIGSNTGSEKINISNGIQTDVPKLLTEISNQLTEEKDHTVKPTIKESTSSYGIQETLVKNDKKPTEGTEFDDPIAGLDWKDGIATLPGSSLKFKMTEFGTLEIVSTVETEKGEVEMSTFTSQTKQDMNPQEAVKNSETSTPVSVIKTSKDAKSKTPTKSDMMKGPPDASHVLCCEVCGKYGLPKDFCVSGRFCGLKCVGMYTGRRNKGREFVRHVKTLDGKIIKKRKKKVPSTIETSVENGQLKAVKNEAEVNKVGGGPVTIKKIKGTKKKIKRIHLDAASLASTDNVPYDSSKPFIWVDYLYASNSKAVPVSVFQQENPELNMFPKPCPEYVRGMKLEAIDPKHPSYICVCTVVRVRGARVRLHFDGWSESYDFWTNADSPLIFPVGWCAKNGQTLSAPRGVPVSEFDFDFYIKDQGSEAVPSNLFKQVSQTRHGFKVDMKLEAIDRKNPDLICVATVTNVIGNRFLVHFDEWDDTYDYWCEEDSPYIHPVGWCEAHGGKLNPPNDDEVDTFTWAEYLKTTGSVAASPELFKKRFAPGYKKGQKLEAVDKRNPSLTRAATVADLDEYKVKLHFDGWDNIYDEWYDADSTDLHPVSYCEKTGHPLEAPLTRADKISSAACPTPGCKGIGHVKGAKYSSHHSTFGCPYSLQNLNKESCLVDRLSTNSMTEESDWSYGKRDKPPNGKDPKDEPVSPNNIGSPNPSCDGSSFLPAHWKSKSISTGCPSNESSRSARNSHLSTSSFSSTKVSISNASTVGSSLTANNMNSKSTARRHSYKEEKPSTTRPKFVEKGIQYISPYYNTWGYGFARLPVNGRREHYSLHDEKPSKEKIEMGKWTVEQVEKHVCSLGCPEQAKLFEEQEIDGEAFLLLTQPDIVNIMKIKLGPALKIFNSIPKH
ncbi:lethal(3)malignant brain tumor-like protein 3 [Actinia tenebrosa]|uniref:Lethal(3)malignant brain tumor-like protein 3 n=1 Tax=Actinia tenebrosa TaxID=6105 RepID=A0A6P8J900_ACTTE|nr:lethal(3)malignant brain tumor-like protein 3 [Actinia tenebrosa]